MRSNIYYFTGTGNSLVIAKGIAKKTGAHLISIPSLLHKKSIENNVNTIGIVFPMYHHGLPYIVERFINKLNSLNNKYIFAVCTYGHNPGICLEHLERVINLNAGVLAAGFAIQMPYNYVVPNSFRNFFDSFSLSKTPVEKQKEMFSKYPGKIDIISQYVLQQKSGALETKAKLIERLVDFLNLKNTLQKRVWLRATGYKGQTKLSFQESIHLMDYGFTYNDKCNECGICSKCPVQNINITYGKPEWQHHCEQCFACIHWCPKEAIQFANKSSQSKTYHHPDVKLSDMMSNLSRKKD